MKQIKISFNIETKDHIAPMDFGNIVSQMESVAYMGLSKMGEFNMTASWGSLFAEPERPTFEKPAIVIKPGVRPAPVVAPIAPVAPVQPVRRGRRPKSEGGKRA